MDTEITIRGDTKLEILEPTQLPRKVQEILREKAIVPNFICKKAKIYCVHYDKYEDDGEEVCCFAFFVMIGGEVHVPVPGQDVLLELANEIGDFIHEDEEEEDDG